MVDIVTDLRWFPCDKCKQDVIVTQYSSRLPGDVLPRLSITQQHADDHTPVDDECTHG